MLLLQFSIQPKSVHLWRRPSYQGPVRSIPRRCPLCPKALARACIKRFNGLRYNLLVRSLSLVSVSFRYDNEVTGKWNYLSQIVNYTHYLIGKFSLLMVLKCFSFIICVLKVFLCKIFRAKSNTIQYKMKYVVLLNFSVLHNSGIFSTQWILLHV